VIAASGSGFMEWALGKLYPSVATSVCRAAS
jgi:hypothetical protein